MHEDKYLNLLVDFCTLRSIRYGTNKKKNMMGFLRLEYMDFSYKIEISFIWMSCSYYSCIIIIIFTRVSGYLSARIKFGCILGTVI